MSRWVNLNNITVPKAQTADNASKFNGQSAAHYDKAISEYQGLNGDTNNPGVACVMIGGGENEWKFYKTIYYQTVGASGRRFQIAYPAGTGVKNIMWRFTNSGNLPSSWNILANKSDLASTVSLAELESIMSLDSKEERLSAISALKAEKLKQIEIMESIIQK